MRSSPFSSSLSTTAARSRSCSAREASSSASTDESNASAVDASSSAENDASSSCFASRSASAFAASRSARSCLRSSAASDSAATSRAVSRSASARASVSSCSSSPRSAAACASSAPSAALPPAMRSSRCPMVARAAWRSLSKLSRSALALASSASVRAAASFFPRPRSLCARERAWAASGRSWRLDRQIHRSNCSTPPFSIRREPLPRTGTSSRPPCLDAQRRPPERPRPRENIVPRWEPAGVWGPNSHTVPDTSVSTPEAQCSVTSSRCLARLALRWRRATSVTSRRSQSGGPTFERSLRRTMCLFWTAGGRSGRPINKVFPSPCAYGPGVPRACRRIQLGRGVPGLIRASRGSCRRSRRDRSGASAEP